MLRHKDSRVLFCRLFLFCLPMFSPPSPLVPLVRPILAFCSPSPSILTMTLLDITKLSEKKLVTPSLIFVVMHFRTQAQFSKALAFTNPPPRPPSPVLRPFCPSDAVPVPVKDIIRQKRRTKKPEQREDPATEALGKLTIQRLHKMTKVANVLLCFCIADKHFIVAPHGDRTRAFSGLYGTRLMNLPGSFQPFCIFLSFFFF
ncbi:hypothetical protein SRHO_G00293360 [Serrasalmus rhombeus]